MEIPPPPLLKVAKMGCCANGRLNKARRNNEESAICRQEEALGFSNATVEKALQTLQRVCTAEGSMNDNQFRTFACELSLNLTDLDSVDSNKCAFYSHFRATKGYDPHKLGVLAALLCQGSDEWKAAALFEHCPGESRGTVQDTGLQALLTFLFDLCVDLLPALAQADSGKPGEWLSASELRMYQSKLRTARAQVWRRVYVALILTNRTLAKADFVTRLLGHKEARRILSPADLRELLSQEPVLVKV